MVSKQAANNKARSRQVPKRCSHTYEAAPKEMPHNILGHGFESIIAGENVVLPAQFTLELYLLGGVKFRRLD